MYGDCCRVSKDMKELGREELLANTVTYISCRLKLC